MRRACDELWRGLRRVWLGLREWSGDAAYEKYVQCSRRIGGEKPLTPAEFYVEQLNRRYARPNRCC
jgi:uncharacterized short protein YbdD (DUF466 family)